MTVIEVLSAIAVPRPNGSRAAEETARFIAGTMRGLTPYVSEHEFFLRPYMQPLLGLFFAVLGAVALLLIVRRRFLPALLVALMIPAVYLGEFELNVPVVTWVGGRTGVNVIADFLPADGPAMRQVTFSAHYDSKTDLFDHAQRKPILGFAPIAMACLVLASALGAIFRGPRVARSARAASVILAVVGFTGLFMLMLVFSGGLLVSRDRQSPGARDNAAAVAVLMALAEDIATGVVPLEQTRVKMIFFGGEEVNMQGSTAYARLVEREQQHSRLSPAVSPAVPDILSNCVVINCELIGGEGVYCYWENSGTFLSRHQASAQAVAVYQAALASLGIEPALPAGAIFDDSGPLLAVGLRAVTVGHMNPHTRDSYHNAGDSLDKVVPAKLEETRLVFREIVSKVDQGEGGDDIL
ncbi:MAG: M28 family metallopeptidase [Firmicutes bacterium]|nr:M28 family metallopeptidase [Bacillota bacterium]